MSSTGHLYIVATPIGNLDDMVPRAMQTLQSVDFIAAEDTRHSGKLLKHFAIDTPMLAYHEHNESERTGYLLGLLDSGSSIALISDAGTPLISDPGYRLVRAAHAAGVSVVPIPGPSALVAALSVSGLPSDQVLFVGFLPSRAQSRRARLQELAPRKETVVIYESCHRIADALADMVLELGPQREVAFCRELTKTFETVRLGSLESIRGWVDADSDQQRGEIVLVVEGNKDAAVSLDEVSQGWLRALAAEMAPARAAALASKVTGIRKRILYEWLTQSDAGAGK
jgi:16S rRNA (cytidine1402-2'-O)-methyltransferase